MYYRWQCFVDELESPVVSMGELWILQLPNLTKDEFAVVRDASLVF
jgi:hypothetical protein